MATSAVDDLAVVVAGAHPGAEVVVTATRRLSAGASRRTLLVEATVDGVASQLVVQVDDAGVTEPSVAAGAPVAAQAELLRRAAAAGVPVPPVVAVDPVGAQLGAPYLATGHVEGETVARRILRDPSLAGARERFAADCGRALAAIHRIDPEGLDLTPVDALAGLRDAIDAMGEPRPVFELAMSWLAAARPAPGRAAVVHGDFRLGNLIVGPDGVRAVLDWELAHLGDPLEDLGWLCSVAWRFGAPGPVGGMGRREDLYRAYEEAGGAAVDPAAARWWEVRAALAWGVICQRQARRHLGGTTPSMELAAIGRRVCETEWDLLRLLWPSAVPDPAADPAADPTDDPTADPTDDPTADPAADPAADPTGGLHGRPTAAELVDAVGGWLSGELAGLVPAESTFHLRIACNVLATVGRELRLGPAQVERHLAGLAALGHPDDASLATAIRDGRAVPDPATLDAVAASVADRLAVANPRYLQRRATPG